MLRIQYVDYISGTGVSDPDKGKHMGPEDPSNRKKYPSFFLKPNLRKLQDDSKYISLKIGSKVPQKLGPFVSLFVMRKTLSSGQKWFVRPYFALIRGMPTMGIEPMTPGLRDQCSTTELKRLLHAHSEGPRHCSYDRQRGRVV